MLAMQRNAILSLGVVPATCKLLGQEIHQVP
jgi:hypothetical protein